jgi:hypothetical protein
MTRVETIKGGAEGYKQEDEAGEALVLSIANIIIFILNKPVRIVL